MTYYETLIEAQVDGAAVTAASATSLLAAASKRTIPPNYFYRVGQKLRVRASGKISSVATTPGTARFDIRMGGNVIFDGLAVLLDTVGTYTDKGWFLDIDLTLRAIGSAGNFMGIGGWTSTNVKGVGTMPLGTLVAVLPWNTAPAVGGNIDLTTSNVLDLFFTQTVATGSITLQQFEAQATPI
jgi:hypothetical protein